MVVFCYLKMVHKWACVTRDEMYATSSSTYVTCCRLKLFLHIYPRNQIILINKSVVEASEWKFDIEKPVEKTTRMEELGDLLVEQDSGGVGACKTGEGW